MSTSSSAERERPMTLERVVAALVNAYAGSECGMNAELAAWRHAGYWFLQPLRVRTYYIVPVAVCLIIVLGLVAIVYHSG